MSAASIVLGLVLTFGNTSGDQLQLTVTLSEAATVALDWGGLRVAEAAAKKRHVLRGLVAPSTAPIRYRLHVGKEPVRLETVNALGADRPLKVAVYGDSRDGPGPHRSLLQAIAAWDPDVLIHTGDLVHQAGDEDGWIEHLSASLPVSAHVPVILSLGNHELWQANDRPERIDGLGEALGFIAPPDDPEARAAGVGPQVFHVRVGRHLFVSLDSNLAMGPGSAQLAFLGKVLEDKADAETIFLSMHHGPLASGRHGGHPEGASLIALAERHGVSLVISGHDHVYERIVRRGVSYVVSGGGGAPLYERMHYVSGSLAFASTYNWVGLSIRGPKIELAAHALEGTLLDAASLPPSGEDPSEAAEKKLLWAGLALFLLVAGLAFLGLRVTLARHPGSG